MDATNGGAIVIPVVRVRLDALHLLVSVNQKSESALVCISHFVFGENNSLLRFPFYLPLSFLIDTAGNPAIRQYGNTGTLLGVVNTQCTGLVDIFTKGLWRVGFSVVLLM